ncbi:MAG: hypothetical protein FJX76_17220 [Armatimonadetes bacterium]|nr:hypothetical protein [Armatimonadota bacterium]
MRFRALGRTIRVATNDEGITPALLSWLPPVREECSDGPLDHDLLVEIDRRSPDFHGRLTADGRHSVASSAEHALLASLEYFIRTRCAAQAGAAVFVHAGAVSVEGRAILIPGHSLSGKSTLVRAFLAAGCTYYSDELAIFDEQGLLWPYPRMLHVRHDDPDHPERVPPAALARAVATAPSSVHTILLTRFETGALWSPRQASAGTGMLHLLEHALALSEAPAARLKTLRRVVESATILEGPRGEAEDLVADLMGSITENCSRA